MRPEARPLRSRAVRARAGAGPGPGPGASGSGFDGIRLAARFEQCCAERGVGRPPAGPSPFHSPTAVVRALMDHLQRPHYPDAGAGVRACFMFCEPREAEGLLPGEAHLVRMRRSWAAGGGWMDQQAFRDLLAEAPFSALVECEEWHLGSETPTFRGGVGDRAAQSVRIVPRRVGGVGNGEPVTGAEAGALGEPPPQGGCLREAEGWDVPFTFFLRRIDAGPFAGCWLSSGAAPGDLAGS